MVLNVEYKQSTHADVCTVHCTLLHIFMYNGFGYPRDVGLVPHDGDVGAGEHVCVHWRTTSS